MQNDTRRFRSAAPALPGVLYQGNAFPPVNPRQRLGLSTNSTSIFLGTHNPPFPIRIFPSNPKHPMILDSPKAYPERLRGRSARDCTSYFSGGARFAPWPAPLALVGLLPCSCHTQVFF